MLFSAILVLGGPEGLLGEERGSFEHTRDWILEVDGEGVGKVEIHFAQYHVAWVVESAVLSTTPLLIRARSESVESVTSDELERDGSQILVGLADPREDVARAELGRDSTVRFELEGHSVVLKPAPSLLGFQATSVLDERHPEFVKRRGRSVQRASAAQHNEAPPPDLPVADAESLTVRVYFGSWSSACRRIVPKIQAVEEAWRGSGLRFEYYGLPQPLIADEHAVEQRIQGVPTVVLLREGEELGRLTGRPLDRPSQSLLDLLVASESFQ